MGLGLNGGGIESVRFLSSRGAIVTVTDLRSEDVLAPALARIQGCAQRIVLGRHDEDDFRLADIVIKNPAVKPGNPYIALARRVETDLTLFLSTIVNPVIGVTGSKGKSTTASAIHHALKARWPGARIGGNITVSPLSWVDELSPEDPVVIEFSSFQLGDIAASNSYREHGRLSAFPPHIAVVTNLFPDHQDYYGSMDRYLADKEFLFRDQKQDDHAIFRADDSYSPVVSGKAPSKTWIVDARPDHMPQGNRVAWISANGEGKILDKRTEYTVLPSDIAIIGRHHRGNLLQAAVALHVMGLEPDVIATQLASFPGIEHRLERCGELGSISFINDSAATIPEAALGAVLSLNAPVHLIAGGTDKVLTFDSFIPIAKQVKALYLLKGSASDKIVPMLTQKGLPFQGPFESLDAALHAVMAGVKSGETVLLSPGCASFGLFLNEFDRGRKFKEAVSRIIVDPQYTASTFS